jgi:hypothetical protein
MTRRSLSAVLFAIAFLSCSLGFGLPQTVRQSALVDSAQLLRDLQALSSDDMQGRQVETPGGAKARAYVVARFKAAGLEPFGDSYEQPFTFGNAASGNHHGVNVVGRVNGARRPARFLVVSAHYDHIGVRNGQVFNGADDNASGTAALSRSKSSAPIHGHSLILRRLMRKRPVFAARGDSSSNRPSSYRQSWWT